MRSRWPSNLLRTHRAAGIGVVAALVAGSLALAFGSGYAANQAVFSGSSAWVRDGDAAVLISSGGGAPQGRVDDVAGGDLVTGPDGTLVFTTEDPSGATTVERYDPDTAGEAARTLPGGPGTAVVANDAGTWQVDRTAGTAVRLDPDSWKPTGDPITLDDGIVGEAIAVDGSLWVLDGAGSVRPLTDDGAGRSRSVDVDRPADARLVVAGDRPVVVDPASGRLLEVGGPSHDVPALRGATVLAEPAQPGPWSVLAAVGEGERTLVALRPGDGGPATLDLGPDPVGTPLAVGADAYVPTVVDGAQRLRHLTLPGLEEVDPVDLPEVPAADDRPAPADGDLGYDAFLVGTRLWANDANAEQALTIGDGEEPRQVAKVLPDADGSGDDPDQVDPTTPPVTQPEPTPAPVVLPDLPSGAAPAPGPGPGDGPGAGTPAPGPGGTPGGGGEGGGPSTEGPVRLEPERTAVPDLDGLDIEAACERLAGAQLACDRVSVDDRDAEEGEVLGQSPAADTQVPVRSTVVVDYALYGTVTVPSAEELNGLSPTEARDVLATAGLNPTDLPQQGVGPNEVLDQIDVASLSIAPGTEVKATSEITFEWNQTYAPLPFVRTMANGQPVAQACDPVRAAGFKDCTTAPGPDLAPDRPSVGTAYSADHEDGSYDPLEPIVILTYASNGEQPIPSFAGGCGEVTAWAQQRNLNVGCADPADGVGPGAIGQVMAQEPAPNTNVGNGETVTLHSYRPGPIVLGDWYRMGEDGVTPSGNHQLNVGNPGWAGNWFQGLAFSFAAVSQPNAARVTCWRTTTGRDSTVVRPECHLGEGQPAAELAPTANGWTNVPIAEAWAWATDPGGAVPVRMCRLIRRSPGNPDRYLGQYYSTGVGANGRWCVDAFVAEAPNVDTWVEGEFFYVLPY